MATVESIHFTPFAKSVVGNGIEWVPLTRGHIDGLPQICWNTGDPWREANIWLLTRARKADIETVRSNARSLLTYARWLESTENTDKPSHWWDFPQREADRCLVRYRGFLIHQSDAGALSPSTVTHRMRDVIQFYRWLYANRLVTPLWPMWKDRNISILLPNNGWFERTITVLSSDLSIPNRKRNSAGLEDGLLPVSNDERTLILELAHEHCSVEFQLMLRLGFDTGMRLGTISDIKVGTLANAIPDPGGADAYLISIGPGAHPPVRTKFRTHGNVMVPSHLFNNLVEYSRSSQRLKRKEIAAAEHKELLFLTRFGNSYVDRKPDKSNAINVEMHKLREIARLHGHNIDHFRFHMSRATFACDAVTMALKYQSEGIDPVEFVGDLLFHKNRSTTEAYIRYVKKQPIKAALANEFTRVFLGVLNQKKTLPHA